jgi:uncharacterized protein with GYD domain
MPIDIPLLRWTAQGRTKTAALPDRVAQVEKRMSELGARSNGNWVTMGRFDQVSVFEAPDDETTAKLALIVAGRGNATTETLRAFTMDEVRALQT